MNRMDHQVCVIAARHKASAQRSRWIEKAASRLPFGRLIDPEETARAANFLVSDGAELTTDATD
jgi:NAD(P)-dependent dehydrogenase (short-subunit alcohol dehydrogenase family)